MSRPTVVCLCGSTRFRQAFELAAQHETIAGRIVITLNVWGHADHPEGSRHLTRDGLEGTPEKVALDDLHLRKIDHADEILVINVGGYVGESTRREIDYARSARMRVRWLFPDHAEDAALEQRADLLERHHDVLREAVARLRPLVRNTITDGAAPDELYEAIEHVRGLRPEDLLTPEPEELVA